MLIILFFVIQTNECIRATRYNFHNVAILFALCFFLIRQFDEEPEDRLASHPDPEPESRSEPQFEPIVRASNDDRQNMIQAMLGKPMNGLYEVTSGLYSGLTIKQVRRRYLYWSVSGWSLYLYLWWFIHINGDGLGPLSRNRALFRKLVRQVGVQTYYLPHFSQKTAHNWKKLDRDGVR